MIWKKKPSKISSLLKTLIVHIDDRANGRLCPSDFAELVVSAHINVAFTCFLKVRTINSKYFIGPGQLQIIKDLCEELCTGQIVISLPLKATNQRHWVSRLKLPVIDLHELVMDIFARRAITYEGKLQVELAQCRYLSTRLKGGWTHLERQKGGIGLRGPGETQLETDRRLLQNRIRVIESRLCKVIKTRSENRKRRLSHNGQIVGIVGCTNAGKSTLFNRLTNANIFAADKMFATLDPTVRKMRYQGLNNCLLIDTVGFMLDFPDELVTAFSATLAELESADLILHVVDASDDNRDEKLACVDHVLSQLSLNAPVKRIYNKIDLLDEVSLHSLEENYLGISSTSTEGVKPLLQFMFATFGCANDPHDYNNYKAVASHEDIDMGSAG